MSLHRHLQDMLVAKISSSGVRTSFHIMSRTSRGKDQKVTLLVFVVVRIIVVVAVGVGVILAGAIVPCSG